MPFFYVFCERLKYLNVELCRTMFYEVYQINFKIGGNIEKTRINSMIQINNEAREIIQDNQDLEELRNRYEDLDISEHSRNIIDDYIACQIVYLKEVIIQKKVDYIQDRQQQMFEAFRNLPV